MKKASYLIQYWALELVGFFFRILPQDLSLRFGAALGNLFFLLGIRRSVALSNLERVYPDRPKKWRRQIAKALYLNLGRNLAELLRFPVMSQADILNLVEFRGREHFDQALREGKGALLITAHFGNWELYGAAIACAGYPLSMVVYPQHNRMVDERLNQLRRLKGSEIIYKRDAVREIFRALKQNRLVAVLIDQDAGRDGVFCDFLGHPASTPRGPALLAYKTGVPLIPGAIVRQAKGKHVGLVHGLVYPNTGDAADREVTRITSELNRIISGYILDNPDHWYWVHRRWKAQPPEPCHPGNPPCSAG